MEYQSKVYIFAPIINASSEILKANKFLNIEIHQLDHRTGEKMLYDLYKRDRFYEFGYFLFRTGEKFYYLTQELDLPELEINDLNFPTNNPLWPNAYLQRSKIQINNLEFKKKILNTFSRGSIKFPEFNLVIKNPVNQSLNIIATIGNQAIGNLNGLFEIDNWDQLYSLENIKTSNLHDYINIAIDHLDKSFTNSDYFSFLSILIAFEVLFNNGKDQIRYTISRNVAVMLGENIEESKEIFKNMKFAYDIRSALVHNGKYKEEDVEKYLPILELYLKKTLKYLLINKISKDELIEKLTQLGFGNSLV
ncbi:hypothetical protein EHQ31_18715 [Leptospira montravelensis]|uniref:Apea-like HEPN domain-containing protein n=1 Tax=Leptospira montravelensis TaxID=2484961 RepID=A0ABY2LL20_9LEPT|nr:HEPN domain-containing protein [Leptospira montravelensis]TGK82692.1 hypothetical protein EHQ19_08415 [Leptospira montravelensis]TGK94997.1 hypothetical protein EHQ31_18715 [Leptospira montravelensis]